MCVRVQLEFCMSFDCKQRRIKIENFENHYKLYKEA